eukprot:11772067-Ditylum_brightwellii.AAC.1
MTRLAITALCHGKTADFYLQYPFNNAYLDRDYVIAIHSRGAERIPAKRDIPEIPKWLFIPSFRQDCGGVQ